MVTRNDLLLLLSEIESDGVDTSVQIQKLYRTKDLSIDVLKFINDHRQFDVIKFYERIRQNHNKNKSPLYTNIMKQVEDPNEVLTTLSAMLNQILLFSRKVDDKQMFLKHSRALEIAKVLTLYFQTYDLTNAQQLLRLIKIDIKAFEELKNS